MCLTIRLEPIQIVDDRLRVLSGSPQALALGWRFEGRSRLSRQLARLSLHAWERERAISSPRDQR